MRQPLPSDQHGRRVFAPTANSAVNPDEIEEAYNAQFDAEHEVDEQ